jgi:hypothetical protein
MSSTLPCLFSSTTLRLIGSSGHLFCRRDRRRSKETTLQGDDGVAIGSAAFKPFGRW